jgi:hypothetical protein
MYPVRQPYRGASIANCDNGSGNHYGHYGDNALIRTAE